MPLGLPYDAAPLYDALIVALTEDVTGTARPRALPAANLYTLVRPEDLALGGPRASEVYGGTADGAARGRPRVGIQAIQRAPIDNTLQMSDRARFDATITISCWYYAHDVNTDAYRYALDAMERDQSLLVGALCYPGALYTVSDSDTRRTGLDSGCLDRARWTVEPRRGQRRGETRVIEIRHRFVASMECTAPGSSVGSNP